MQMSVHIVSQKRQEKTGISMAFNDLFVMIAKRIFVLAQVQ